MKTRMNILTLACALTCFSCIGTAHTIQPSKNYQTKRQDIGAIQAVATSSSIDIVYHQTSGSPYAEIYAADNVMPYVVLDESDGELTAYYKPDVSLRGENRCRIDVYAPSVSRFTTKASGDISVPKGLHSDGKIQFCSYASGDIECPSVQCGDFKAETCASGEIDVQQVNCRKLQAGTNASGDLTIKEATCRQASLSVNASGDCTVSRLQCQTTLQGSVNASGDLTVAGTCPKAVFRSNASGDLEADHLKADEVDAEVNGSGDLSCYASGSLTARTYSSGSINYAGNPSHLVTEGKHIYKK